jgi:hypothetical protein
MRYAWCGGVVLLAWVLWLETYSLPRGTEQGPKGAYPNDGYQACLEDARDNAAARAREFRSANLKGVSTSTGEGPRFSVMAELKPNVYYHWTYYCLPDTVDPRKK